MKIKQSTEFVSFSDGVCNIYTEDDDGNKVYKYSGLAFSNQILGYNRIFAAKAVQVQANAVIKIPNVPGIDNHNKVEINGVGKYNVEAVQIKFDTNPQSIDLTLRQLEMW